MKRSVKNFVRLIALALAMLMLSSCSGCNFAELFNIVLPEETEESETPITPDGSYTNSEAQSGLVDDDSSEEPTEEVIVQYNAAMENKIRQVYLEKYKPIISGGTLQVQFLGQVGNTYCVHVIDTSVHGHTGAYDIAGYEFRYLSGRKINVYHEGNLYLLEEAYEHGFVTVDDVAAFNAKFREINAQSYKYIYPESNIREDNVDLMIMGRISIMIQPAYNSKEYTKEDFADVRCVSLRDWGVTGESNEIHKFYTIYLPEDIDTPEEMLEIVRQLEKRDDIYASEISFAWAVDSMPEDNEYMVEDYWAIHKINLPAVTLYTNATRLSILY